MDHAPVPPAATADPSTSTSTFSADDTIFFKEKCHRLLERIESTRRKQETLISNVSQTLIPELASSLDLSLQVISAVNSTSQNPKKRPFSITVDQSRRKIPLAATKYVEDSETRKTVSRPERERPMGRSAKPAAEVRSMVAGVLLDRNPFTVIDSAAVIRKLDGSAEVSGEAGVESALRSLADSGVIDIDDFVVNGKTRIMVLGIERSRLLKELPENLQKKEPDVGEGPSNAPSQEIWQANHHFPAVYPGLRGGNRVLGMMGMPRPVGIRPSLPPLGNSGGKGRLEDEDLMKDLEALLNRKSFREMQKSKTGEELLDLIHRPTARETAVAARFKTKGGPQLKEFCAALTKEDCRRQNNSFIACEKVHYCRIIAPHTDTNLGDCSFLDTCRHMKTCKYVHYELDPTPDVPPMKMGSASPMPPKPIKPQRAEYCSEVELGEPQWINCDIRSFKMEILGKFGVVMADPPWDIHMELPYGTMADDEMRNLNVPALQTDGLIFLWVTGRAMELGRECLELWGYKRVEEIIWVKTNQLQRIIRTGRTGHWLNHSKEHCLVGIKGSPVVNRNIDTDVIVAEVRETSRKPDEMYPLLERISPRTRKLELFARMHNTHAGWISLGNQLQGVRLVDEGLRARYKAAYPDIPVEPVSPPRASVVEVEPVNAAARSPFSGSDPKPVIQFDGSTDQESFASEEKPMVLGIESVG